MREGKILRLLRASEFLRDVTAYSGLLKNFDDGRFAIFYTMTRRLDGLARTLYITLFDYKERSSFIFTREAPKSASLVTGEAVILSGSPIEVDLEHDIIHDALLQVGEMDEEDIDDEDDVEDVDEPCVDSYVDLAKRPGKLSAQITTLPF